MLDNVFHACVDGWCMYFRLKPLWTTNPIAAYKCFFFFSKRKRTSTKTIKELCFRAKLQVILPNVNLILQKRKIDPKRDMRSFFQEAFNYSVQTTFFTLANNNEKLRAKYLLKAPCVPMSNWKDKHITTSWERLIPKYAITDESDESFKKRFTAERSRRRDILKQTKLPFQVRTSVQRGRVSFSCHGTSWRQVMEENWTCPSKSTE